SATRRKSADVADVAAGVKKWTVSAPPMVLAATRYSAKPSGASITWSYTSFGRVTSLPGLFGSGRLDMPSPRITSNQVSLPPRRFGVDVATSGPDVTVLLPWPVAGSTAAVFAPAGPLSPGGVEPGVCTRLDSSTGSGAGA